MKDDMLERPNIPYDRPPKISEIVQLLRYFIDQKKLFEDDIIIAIFNHSGTPKDLDCIHHWQQILLRRRDRPFIAPSTKENEAGSKQIEEWIRAICRKCYVAEIIKQLESLPQYELLDTVLANPGMLKLVELGKKYYNEDDSYCLSILNMNGGKNAVDVKDWIGDGRVFNAVTGEELLDAAKKAELLASMKGA